MVRRSTVAEEIASTCLMGRLRHLSRVVTALYDEELRAYGIQASQLALLTAVAAHQPVRRSELGRLLHYDSSTLTRNLKVLLANGWILEVADTRDRRAKRLEIGPEGHALLDAVAPAWRRAQAKTERRLGRRGRDVATDLVVALRTGDDA